MLVGVRTLHPMIVIAACGLAACFLDHAPEGYPCTRSEDCTDDMFCHSDANVCVLPCKSDSDCASEICNSSSRDDPRHCEPPEAGTDTSAEAAISDGDKSGCKTYCAHVSQCLSPACKVTPEVLGGNACVSDCESRPGTWNQIPTILAMPCQDVRRDWCAQVPSVAEVCTCGG